MRSIVIRTLSGAVFVSSIIIPLIFSTVVYHWIIAIYGLLVLAEFVRLISMAFSGSGFSGLQLFLLKTAISVVWIVIPFSLMALLPQFAENRIAGSDGASLTLSVFVLTWAHDTFAYLTGLAFGKRKLIPSVSPAKTVGGAIGGAAFAFIMAVLAGYIVFPDTPLWFWLGGAAAVTLFANIGDLAESGLKRLAGVKDSGRGMPGHGGFFDRFDSLIATAPAWLLWIIVLG